MDVTTTIANRLDTLESDSQSIFHALAGIASDARAVRDSYDAMVARVAEVTAENQKLRENLAALVAFNESKGPGLDAYREMGAEMARIDKERHELESLTKKIIESVENYMLSHDTNGDGHILTGRAWDAMRRSLATAKDWL